MIFYLKNQAVQISGKTYGFQCALFARAAMCITNWCGPMSLPVLPPLLSMSFPPRVLLMSLLSSLAGRHHHRRHCRYCLSSESKRTVSSEQKKKNLTLTALKQRIARPRRYTSPRFKMMVMNASRAWKISPAKTSSRSLCADVVTSAFALSKISDAKKK